MPSWSMRENVCPPKRAHTKTATQTKKHGGFLRHPTDVKYLRVANLSMAIPESAGHLSQQYLLSSADYFAAA